MPHEATGAGDPPRILATFAAAHGRLWIVFAFGSVWLAGAVSILIRRGSVESPGHELAVGTPCLVAFGYGVLCLARILRNRPAVVVRADGFEERAGMFTMGFVPWDEVTSLVVYGTRRHTYLVVYVRDPYALLSSRPLVTRLGKRATMLLGWPPVTIPQAMVKARLALVREPMVAAANALRAVDGRVEVVDRMLD